MLDDRRALVRATWLATYGALILSACFESEQDEPLVLPGSTGGAGAVTTGGTGGGAASPTGGSGLVDPPTGGTSTGGTATGGARTGGAPTGGTGSSGTTGGTAPDLPPVTGNCSGWSSRYWDCCKPHCAWKANVSGNPTRQCSAGDQTLSSGDPDSVQSACNGGPAHMCHGMAPWVSAENANLSYGFAAVQNTGSVCGGCYRLQFTGAGHSGNSPGAQAISGKQMIVQVTNVGGLETGQFDLLVPGGGVGDFDACSSQWGSTDIGERYGGFLTTCQQTLGYNAQLSEYKSCVSAKCESVFGSRFPELRDGCQWFVDWYQVADNPAFVYEPVACPSELTSASGLTAQSASGC